jgi:hypothetical protein
MARAAASSPGGSGEAPASGAWSRLIERVLAIGPGRVITVEGVQYRERKGGGGASGGVGGGAWRSVFGRRRPGSMTT